MACDDLRPLMNCYGHSQMHTPNFDRLAAQSVLFERNICQQPICMASRASFMTGRRPDRDNIYSCQPLHELNPEATTINRHFAKAGYDVYGTGKIYHYAEDNKKQFEPRYYSTDGKAFGRGYVNPESQALIDQNSAERMAMGLGPEKPKSGRGPCTEIGRGEDSDYPDGAAADWAIQRLDAHKDSDPPLFLSVGWKKPHLPFVAPEKYWDLYDRSEIELPASSPVSDAVPEYSHYFFQELRNYVDVPFGKAPLDEELSRRLMHGYYACVSFLDAQVGRVLDALDRNGLTEDTIIVFMADHGFQLLEHQMWCKHTCFWPSYHVPMIISAPGVTLPGGRIRGLSENIDLFPTLCDLAGVAKPEQIDGTSMVDWLGEPARGGKGAAFTQWPSSDRNDPEAVIMGYTVLNDAGRYTEWTHRHSGKVLARELYDHRVDKDENNNVADASEMQDIQVNMSKLLAEARCGCDS